MSYSVEELINELENAPRNREYTERGIPPVFQISHEARILIIGQAPGKKVEESLIPFNDKSGEKLMEWMGIDRDTFYSEKIAIVPMDFYYPGKGKREICFLGSLLRRSITRRFWK